MQTQVFLTCCVVVLMAAHAVLAQSALAECYQTTNGATFGAKSISADMEECYDDDRGTSAPDANTPCKCAAAAEAQGMNSFKYSVDGSCLLYRGLAEDDSEGTMVVYSVTSAPFEPADHEFDLEVPAGIDILSLKAISVYWSLTDPCGAVTTISAMNILDGNRTLGDNYRFPTNGHRIYSSNICKIDEVAFQCHNADGLPIGPEVIWVNPRASDQIESMYPGTATIQLYEGRLFEGSTGESMCFLATDIEIEGIADTRGICVELGGQIYGDGYLDTFNSSVTITRDYWVDVTSSDGIIHTWGNGDDASYSAQTWIAQPDKYHRCAYIGDKSAKDPFMLGSADCNMDMHYVACTNSPA